MLGGSPIKVAVPCRLLDMAMAIIMFTGLISSFFANARAMGATIKTVATFSTKAEIKPVKIQIKSIAHPVLFDLSTISSAKKAGTLLLIKLSARANVPTKMPITFQFIEKKASLVEIAPVNISNSAPVIATYILLLGQAMKSM